METPKHKYITVEYTLYTVEGDKRELVEQTSKGNPFQFISGFGITLDEFEKRTVDLEEGTDFDFTLTKEQAYGEYEKERVINLGRDVFCINGHFDHEHIYKDAIVPLQNEDGNRFYGRVLEVGDDNVLMDLNHQLAGKELNFIGKITENRDATDAEIQAMINRLSGEGCGCGCGDCGGCDDCDDNCGHDHHEGDHCGCGHDHHEGDHCGCGHDHHEGDHCGCGCGHHHH